MGKVPKGHGSQLLERIRRLLSVSAHVGSVSSPSTYRYMDLGIRKEQ